MTVNGKGSPTDDDILTLAKDFGLSLKKCITLKDDVKISRNMYLSVSKVFR